MTKLTIRLDGLPQDIRQMLVERLANLNLEHVDWEFIQQEEDNLRLSDAAWDVVIAERKADDSLSLHESRSRYQALAEAANDMIFVIGRDDCVQYVNSAACRSLSLPQDEIIGTPLAALFPPPVAQQYLADIHSVMAAGESAYFEAMHPEGDRMIWLGTSLVPLRAETGEITAVLGVARDITAQKSSEVELRKAFQQEKELSELRAQFAKMVSHEFGTPLSAILSSAELLEYYAEQWPVEKRLKHLKIIRDSARHLDHVLKTLLEMQQMQSRRIACSPEMVDLPVFCEAVVTDLELALEVSGRIALHLDSTHEMGRMDVSLLRQALNNLLTNALKYSPPESLVELDVTWSDDRVTFTIRDHGIGIPEDEIPHIFENFFRGNLTAHVHGYGLGLPMARMAVDLMGGEIHLASSLGSGTTVTLVLPKDQSALNVPGLVMGGEGSGGG